MTNLSTKSTQFLKTLSVSMLSIGVITLSSSGHVYAGTSYTTYVPNGTPTGSTSATTSNNTNTSTTTNTSSTTSGTSTSTNNNDTTINGSASTATSINGSNVSFNSTRDCDTNAIMRCGAMDTGELVQKYNAADNNTRAVYTYYNISSSDIANMPSSAVAGKVHKNGTVTVNGTVVARDAISAGWHNMPGSSATTYNGVTFYNSSPAVSFVADQIDAYVVLNQNGQFQYAILASCANPVKATNVVPAPAPAPTPTSAPTPAPVAQPVVATPAPVTEATPEILPVTGAASVATYSGIFIAVTMLATAMHRLYTRRKNAFNL